MYRHHVEPRVKLYSPKEESFTIPLKYIDVSRTTHTNLDVMQERCIDDYWNIDGSRDLSDPWTGFTEFTLLGEKPPNGFMWSRRKSGHMRRYTSITHENLRGIYFIDPEDKEFKETIRNAHKKLETPKASAMLCKTSKNSKHGETRGKSNEIESELACILEATETTRLRMGETLPNHHEDHIAGKGDKSLQHFFWYTNFSYASSHEDSRSKSSNG